ncbi:DUF3048 domain-containing protein [Candidatus Uhrbacteria bacterium]|jgi:hypothetical protein|nr:DUF3048 domain-containing protein [Candidatus Uhrbacteria bacterium]MBT7717554.1 DUF3048 domain-containing protein [Candidatus Uhrbacteria bacterium]
MKKIRKQDKRVQKKAEQRKGLASFVSFAKQKEILVGVGALILVGAIALLVFGLTVDGPVDIVEEIFEEQIPRHPLTGAVLDEELEELPQVFGVMVENAADAWPLSGIDEAFLVIEAPVEASIPRFIAFFGSDSEVEKIGPVRSARPYYIDWNDGLQAIYTHVGGSPEALELIKSTYDTLDLNQFWYADYFYRENGTRYAPHNVFTDIEMLVEAWADVFGDVDEPDYDVWEFADDAPVGVGKSVSIDWTDGTTYDVSWEYQPETNDYLRYQGLSVMTLEDGDTVEANNIAVIATDIRVIDNEGRRSIVTEGGGDALIIQNGEMYLARWKKSDHDDRLKFYTADGYEISFNAGSTWIEIVSSLSQVETE